VNDVLTDFDTNLMRVLDRHEEDFLAAYKTHMMKVEKELYMLKQKAKDQEQRLAQDEKLLELQRQEGWFDEELDKLKEQDEEGQDEIQRLHAKIKQMKEEREFMADQVKA